MTGKWNLRSLWVLPLAPILVLAALPAQGATAELTGVDMEIATMAIHGGSVSFASNGGFDEMTLTVGGQGHFSQQSFRSGETASFAPVDSEGFQLPDGTYNWELVASPSLKDLNPREFKNGKVSADGRSMEAATAPGRQVQSGVFTVKNGVLVDPDLVELDAGPGRKAQGASTVAAPPSAADRSAEHTDRDGN